jgi:hypothetical protein
MNILQKGFANLEGHRVLGGTMSIAWRQYDCNLRRRQQRLEEIQGYEWGIRIFFWLGALPLFGVFVVGCLQTTWSMVQLAQYVPGLLR